MKKIGLLTTLLVAGLLLTGCNKTLIENPEIIDDCVTADGEDSCAVDIEEPVVEEPTYEILEWTGYACFDGFCDDETYYERELVQYTNHELGLKITTPKYLDIFECTDDAKQVFLQKGNSIFAIDCKNEDIPAQEVITMYTKDPEESLEDIIKDKHINDGCIYTNYLGGYGYYQVDDPEKWISGVFEGLQYFTTHNKEACDYWGYDIITNENADDTLSYEYFIKGEMIYIFYVESEDKTRYYKVLQKTSPVGGRTIFGKIEIL